MQKTFVLGVGAQKSGTTWLHQYLASQPNADLGFAKEYHIWDAIHTPECRRHKVVLSNLLKSRKCRRRWLMQARSFYYFSYFSSLLGRPGVTITADITPAYSSLDGAVFDTIQAGFVQREVACKVVFLMRDPVERCLSAVAHELQKRRLPEKSDYTRDIREYVISKPCEIRTNYARTAQNIESTFAESNIFYGLYEEMFEEVELRVFRPFSAYRRTSNSGG